MKKQSNPLVIVGSLVLVAAVAAVFFVANPSSMPETAIKIDPNAPVVYEFFSYYCPHCAALEPSLSKWKNKIPSSIVVKQAPIGFGRANWILAEQAFYAAQAQLNAANREQVHAKVFTAIHSQGAKLGDREEWADLYASLGLDRAKFLADFDSLATKTLMSEGRQYAKHFQVTGIPILFFHGKAYSVSDYGTPEKMFRALDSELRKAFKNTE